jgi:acetyl esterase/lipase
VRQITIGGSARAFLPQGASGPYGDFRSQPVRPLKRLLIAAALLASAGFALALTPMSTLQRFLIWGWSFDLEEAVAYGPLERQKLDIYTPADGTPKATIVFFYGGSWKSGTRSLYRFLGDALTSRGYQLVVPDYRLWPEAGYPAFLEDSAKAVAWVKANIAARGSSPDRVFLMGHSAGGYNAAMLALAPDLIQAEGADPARFLGVVPLAAPLSFKPLEWESTREIFAASAEDPDSARPIKRVRADAPAFLLIHGTGDKTVGDHNSRNMAAALGEAGGRAEIRLYEGAGHLTPVTCFAWGLRWQAPCLDDVTRFFETRLAAQGVPARTDAAAAAH